MACPICGNVGATRERAAGQDAERVSCPTCGQYDVTGPDAANLARPESFSEEDRWRLTWATRHASERGSTLRLPLGEVLRAAESVAEPRLPTEKLDLLLREIGSRKRTFGESATFDPEKEWPLIYARGPQEATRLLSALVALHWLNMSVDGSVKVLTLEGWKRLGDLPPQSAASSTKVFVAMWFDPEMKPAFDLGFRLALEALGYQPIRVDWQEYLGRVDDFIVASIRESTLLVADFTGHRGGVYFEAGFAMGLGIPVIFTCREDEIEGAHFDTRQYNHLVWKDPADLANKLRTRIEATVIGRPRPR
jgi:hypothetical protein